MKQSTSFIQFIQSFHIDTLYGLYGVLDASGSATYSGELFISIGTRYRFYTFNDTSMIAIRYNLESMDQFVITNYPNGSAIQSKKRKYPASSYTEF